MVARTVLRLIGAVGVPASLLLLLFPREAYAYIDPGTGSLILQLIAAGLVTVAVVFRKSISRLALLFRRPRK
jgi:hypothetical protein